MKKNFFKLTLLAAITLIFLGVAAFFYFPAPGQIPVLMYHFIGDKDTAALEKNHVSRESFTRQMEFLKSFGYRVISIEEYYEIRTGVRKPRGREVLLTFDDGNYTFASEAMPVLSKFHFPATIFLISEFVKSGEYGSMKEEQVREILKQGGVSVGSHTKTHPFLSKIPEAQLRDELEGSKKDLEALFDRPIRFIAYPSGDLSPQVLEAAQKAGYELGFTTSPKKLKGLPSGAYSITRVKISRTSDSAIAFWFKLSGLYGSFKTIRAAQHFQSLPAKAAAPQTAAA